MDISIKVPATSANIGPGFDCLGLALDLYATFRFRTSETLVIDGCEERFRGSDNLVWTSYLDACQRLYQKPLDGLHLTIDSPIPLSGGLGSSSCCVVAGVMAAQLIHLGKVDPDLSFNLAVAIEGHPDNVAPAIYGGLVASYSNGQDFFPISFPISDKLSFVVFAPPYEVRTADARRVMPTEVSLETTIWQTSHAIALLEGLKHADEKILREAAQDRLHEPYRAKLIPHFEPLKRCCLSAGAAAFVISGSGSTMMAICVDEKSTTSVIQQVEAMVENKVEGLWTRRLSLGQAASHSY